MDAIGDAILANSILAGLPDVFPRASVTVACDTVCAPLYEACPFVERVIPLNKNRLPERDYLLKAMRLLQACRPELVLHTTYSSTAHAHALALAAGAPAIAMTGNTSNLLPEEKSALEAQYLALVPSPGEGRAEPQRHADWLRWLRHQKDAAPLIWLRDEHRARAKEIWAGLGFAPERTIALAPIGSFVKKDYFRFTEALVPLCRERGLSIAALGGPADADYVENIVRECEKRGVAAANLAGRLSILESCAVLENCCLLTGVETGLVHAACALGVPNVAVLGGGHFGRFLPCFPLSTAVCLPLDCYGCNWRCKYQEAHCVQGIAPESVTQAITDALERRTFTKPALFIQHETTWPRGPDLPQYSLPKNFIKARKTGTGLRIVIGK
jgi:ADP-heptose:LPS heptosyltransferase